MKVLVPEAQIFADKQTLTFTHSGLGQTKEDRGETITG
jgi:hypothetical protein